MTPLLTLLLLGAGPPTCTWQGQGSLRVVTCAGHSVVEVDLGAFLSELSQEATKAPPSAPSASVTDALTELRELEETYSRAAVVTLDDSRHLEAEVSVSTSSLDGGASLEQTLVTVRGSTHWYSCFAPAGTSIQHTVDRCKPTLVGLLDQENPESDRTLCQELERSNSYVVRSCGALRVIESLESQPLERIVEDFEATWGAAALRRKQSPKTVVLSRTLDRWVGWVGLEPQPFINFLWAEHSGSTAATRFFACGPVAEGKRVPQGACPLLVRALIRDADPREWAQHPADLKVLGLAVVPAAGCSVKNSKRLEGALECDEGALFWTATRGRRTELEAWVRGQNEGGPSPLPVKCTVMGRPARCLSVPARGAIAAKLFAIASRGDEWVRVVCSYTGSPAATCGAVVTLVGKELRSSPREER